jgi:5-methylcytosine-specific restriction endonuclease McrA
MSAMPQPAPPNRAGSFPALVLNADYLPLSSYPLSIWPWEAAVNAVLSDRVAVVAHHDQVARSPSVAVQLPSVVALRAYVPMKRTPAFTRHNVMLRDRYCCGYCGRKFPSHELTFDHIVPRAQGGKTSWTNIVMACAPCNSRKGARTPSEAGMTILWRPWQPSVPELARAAGRLPAANLYNGWRDFLYWDGDLSE